jgi:hypothetical protein
MVKVPPALPFHPAFLGGTKLKTFLSFNVGIFTVNLRATKKMATASLRFTLTDGD